jgi:hypothetical protein
VEGYQLKVGVKFVIIFGLELLVLPGNIKIGAAGAIAFKFNEAEYPEK